MPYQPQNPQLESDLTRPTFKLTLPLILVTGGLSAVFLTSTGGQFSLIFKELEALQLWRLGLSFLASYSPLELGINMVAAVLLTFISERVNGSGYYTVDLLTKNFLINLVTLVVYILMLCSAIVFDSPLGSALQTQTGNPTRGLLPLLFLEIVHLVLNFGSDGDEWLKNSFSRFSVTMLTLLAVPIALSFYDCIWVYSSLCLGVAFKLKLIDYSGLLEGVGCLRGPGARAYSKLMYPNAHEVVSADFYEAGERASLDSRKATVPTEPSSASREEVAPDEERPEEKSRYDTVNVNDYKLANKQEKDEITEQESFEI